MKKEYDHSYFVLQEVGDKIPAVAILVGSKPRRIPYMTIYDIDKNDGEPRSAIYHFEDRDLKRLYKALKRHLNIKE